MSTREKETYSADNRTGVNHGSPDANRPVERLTAKSIIGDKIENRDGENIGKVNNLMINLSNGKVEYAVIEYGAVLGVGGKLFAIPFQELKLDAEEKKFILDRDKDFMKDAPGFDPDHWPETNDHTYFDDVRMYYGSYLPPFP